MESSRHGRAKEVHRDHCAYRIEVAREIPQIGQPAEHVGQDGFRSEMEHREIRVEEVRPLPQIQPEQAMSLQRSAARALRVGSRNQPERSELGEPTVAARARHRHEATARRAARPSRGDAARTRE